MSKVSIGSVEGAGSILIDGFDISHIVNSVGLNFTAGSLPKTSLKLVAGSTIDLSASKVVISGTEIPPSVEKALLAFLLKKYPTPPPPDTDTTARRMVINPPT